MTTRALQICVCAEQRERRRGDVIEARVSPLCSSVAIVAGFAENSAMHIVLPMTACARRRQSHREILDMAGFAAQLTMAA
jgi:hypothetical protein